MGVWGRGGCLCVGVGVGMDVGVGVGWCIGGWSVTLVCLSVL